MKEAPEKRAQPLRPLKHGTSTAATLQPRPQRRSDAVSFGGLLRSEVENVIVYLLDSEDYSFERWDLVAGTLKVNRQNKSIRFGVRAVGPAATDPFQVVIHHVAAGWAFKSDCFEEAETEHPLRAFKAAHSALFVFSGKSTRFYFHMEMAG